MRPDEGRTFLDIQARSVRGLAAETYPADVLDAWAAKTDDEAVQRFSINQDDEIRLIAEVDGAPAGLGALVVANSELRACYVLPHVARHGVGTALVNEIERIAKKNSLKRLELLASLNAEPFYRARGYHVCDRSEHVLRNSVSMAAVRMEKALVTSS